MNRMYYDDYSNGCVIVPKPHHNKDDKSCEIQDKNNCETNEPKCCETITKQKNQLSFFDNLLTNFSLDDIILIAIIFIFLNDGCEDKTLLLIIGAIFLLGFN